MHVCACVCVCYGWDSVVFEASTRTVVLKLSGGSSIKNRWGSKWFVGSSIKINHIKYWCIYIYIGVYSYDAWQILTTWSASNGQYAPIIRWLMTVSILNIHGDGINTRSAGRISQPVSSYAILCLWIIDQDERRGLCFEPPGVCWGFERVPCSQGERPCLNNVAEANVLDSNVQFINNIQIVTWSSIYYHWLLVFYMFLYVFLGSKKIPHVGSTWIQWSLTAHRTFVKSWDLGDVAIGTTGNTSPRRHTRTGTLKTSGGANLLSNLASARAKTGQELNGLHIA